MRRKSLHTVAFLPSEQSGDGGEPRPNQNALGGRILRHPCLGDRRSAGLCLLHLRRRGTDRHLAAIPLCAISRMRIADSIETVE